MAALIFTCASLWGEAPQNKPPIPIIFDTDIGNDVDDVLALSMLHALQSRGVCRLLAVTVTNPDPLAGPFVDAVNTFYSRPGIPIGCIRPPPTNAPSKFLRLADVKDNGNWRYPHKLKIGLHAPKPVDLLRKLLAAEADGSVMLVQVGYFSNFAALLDSQPDSYSSLSGRDLLRKKVRLLSVMAGAFQKIGTNDHYLEFNVVKDITAARRLAAEWPTPIVWSGFEIGIAVPFPAVSIERDFGYVAHHPAAEAYYLYEPPPHERPTWDLTAVLYAAFADRSYFSLSPRGRVTVEPDGFTRFKVEGGGRDQFLILSEGQILRVKEALVQLSSQPPNGLTR